MTDGLSGPSNTKHLLKEKIAMRFKNPEQPIRLSFSKDETGQLKPHRFARVHFRREEDDPLDEKGQFFSGSHQCEIDLLNPRPEDDPNTHTSAENISLIKEVALEAAKDGVYIDWELDKERATVEVASATAAVAAEESGADERLALAEAWLVVTEAKDAEAWLVWAKGLLA